MFWRGFEDSLTTPKDMTEVDNQVHSPPRKLTTRSYVSFDMPKENNSPKNMQQFGMVDHFQRTVDY